MARVLDREVTSYGDYQNGGYLLLNYRLSGTAQNYRSTLDLKTWLAQVSFSVQGVDYRRQCFASYPDGVLGVYLSASEAFRLMLRLRPRTTLFPYTTLFR